MNKPDEKLALESFARKYQQKTQFYGRKINSNPTNVVILSAANTSGKYEEFVTLGFKRDLYNTEMEKSFTK